MGAAVGQGTAATEPEKRHQDPWASPLGKALPALMATAEPHG
jgi:hypothetical protein